MDFGKAGWLSSLIEETVAQHALGPLGPPEGRSPRSAARAYLRRALRVDGLLYAPTPAGVLPSQSRARLPQDGRTPEALLYFSIVATLARMALDLASLLKAPPGPRREQLLVLFASFTGLLNGASALDKRIQERRDAAGARLLWARVERALEKKARSLSGDPVNGLVLHNGAVYADAHGFGRDALGYFASGTFSPVDARRRLEFAARQKALLVDVLAGLASVDASPSFSTRRAILHQVEVLELPGPIESKLRLALKQTFQLKRRTASRVADVRGTELKHFLLEQTMLAALAEGRHSAAERDYVQALAEALGIAPREFQRMEKEMATFYAEHRAVVDVFTESGQGSVMGKEMVAGVQASLEKNFHRLMQEVRETGELSLLLGKAARRQKLTADERQRMRAQLIDLAKVIPALAIFAAPGGLLLLIALAKVLPFNLLPSAFQDPPAERALPEGEPGPERH